eukprot:CAMPEP_0118934484 /NCGR_PEP_ID=MMETSP1169-20130426/13847_1 /TAXON_ID=36882 /ORGANISM="Pyramimonas obovata, Strain CCMP722" /LENGTH=176 /DNA_ID=CAMNT_0006877393 /DNA_START=55 /DNA_END=585 /DNA_ORIENTATION=-
MLRIAGLNAVRQAFRPVATRSFSTAVSKELDWNAISAAVETDAGRSELMSLKSIYMDIVDKAKPKNVAPIDWAALKAETGNPELVSQFETTLKGMKPAKFEGDIVQQAQASFAALIKEAEAHVAESNARIAELEVELAKVRAEKDALNTTTIEEILEGDAALKEEVQEEVRQGKWF